MLLMRVAERPAIKQLLECGIEDFDIQESRLWNHSSIRLKD
jgi:hypothetical protein